MDYHITVTIEIDKTYCVKKYQNKSMKEISEKLRELSLDKTNWSSKVLNRFTDIINKRKYSIPLDLLKPQINHTKVMGYQLENDIGKYSKDELISKTHFALSTNKDKTTEIDEIELKNDIKYNKFNDILLAQLILTLSQISKESEKLWAYPTIRIKELGSNLFYFKPDTGYIEVSKRGNVKIDINAIKPYIDLINELIDGKRNVPIL